MINYKDIEQTLLKLDVLYNSAIDTHEIILYSKLGTLEFSGWLEEGFDNILYEYLNKYVGPNYRNFCGKKIIEKNYGLCWENNTRKMINSVIGTKKLEELENVIESTIGGISLLKPLLNNLTLKRNKAAHTHTVISTPLFDSPSVILSNFRQVKPIITEIEDLICNYI